MLAAILAAAAPSLPDCRAMAVSVSAGDVVGPSDTRPVACTTSSSRLKLRYDRTGHVARAAVDLNPGDELGHVFLPVPSQVLPGDRVAVAARLGSVTVSRVVIALQTSSGSSLFVRDDGGKVFKVSIRGGHVLWEAKP